MPKQLIKLPNFNYDSTLLGGQAFNWDPDAEDFVGFTQNKIIKLSPRGDRCHWEIFSNMPIDNPEEYIKNYLAVDHDHAKALQEMANDEQIQKCAAHLPHTRILNQDFQQTLLSFLMSSNNNIKAIRRSIRILAETLGDKITIDRKVYHLFPSTETFATVPIQKILDAGLGFRAKFIQGAAQYILANNLTEKIKKMNLDQARAELIKINGIGPKIADCILCFSLGFTEVTPLDVWALRAVNRYYGLPQKMKYDDVSRWLTDRFKHNTAYAGQYLFEYIRQYDND